MDDQSHEPNLRISGTTAMQGENFAQTRHAVLKLTMEMLEKTGIKVLGAYRFNINDNTAQN